MDRARPANHAQEHSAQGTIVITGGARGLGLGSLASIHAFANELTTDLRDGHHPPLRVVLCNAGLQVYRRASTADGFADNLALLDEARTRSTAASGD